MRPRRPRLPSRMAKQGWPGPTAFVLLVVLAACGGQGPNTPDAVTGVTVTPSAVSLVVGGTRTLAATVTTTGSAAKTVSWQSSDPEVATVSTAGLVQAVAVGSATVTASSTQDPSKFASAQVTVTSEGGPDGSVPLEWTVQFGTIGLDRGQAVAVDSQGAIVVVGFTNALMGEAQAGGFDVFVSKRDAEGEELWTRQFGTADAEAAYAVAVDASDGIIVGGYTWGTIGERSAGSVDAFLRRYTSEGEVAWTEQFGTSKWDEVRALAVDAEGDIVVAGQGVNTVEEGGYAPENGFVRKYRPDEDGNGLTLVWSFDVPTIVQALAVDEEGFIVAAGHRGVEDHGEEIYLLKLTPGGEEVWTRSYGTGTSSDILNGPRDEVPSTRHPRALWEGLSGYEDRARAVAVDAQGRIHLTGYVGGWETGTGHSSQKAFVMTLDPDGEELRALLFGDLYATVGVAIALAPGGGIVLGGNTVAYYDQRSPSGSEMFTRRLASDGTLLWEDLFGGELPGEDRVGLDYSTGLVVDSAGLIFQTGFTLGELGGENLGVSDVFLRKYGE